MLVDVFPDSDNTYCGSLIDQGGYYKKFDVDCDISDYSEIKRKDTPNLKDLKLLLRERAFMFDPSLLAPIKKLIDN